jgi:alpha-D-xyloside xylohydrolase
MFGPALMACPVGYYKARNRSVYFPKQSGWYDLYTGEKVIDKETANSQKLTANSPVGRSLIVDAPYERIPVYVREGSIIPYGPEMQYSDERPAADITLYVYAGSNGEFQLYEDEGTNYNYEKGKFATIDIAYDDAAKTLTFGKRNGDFKGMLKERTFRIVYVTADQPRALDFEPQNVPVVNYKGNQVVVNL